MVTVISWRSEFCVHLTYRFLVWTRLYIRLTFLVSSALCSEVRMEFISSTSRGTDFTLCVPPSSMYHLHVFWNFCQGKYVGVYLPLSRSNLRIKDEFGRAILSLVERFSSSTQRFFSILIDYCLVCHSYNSCITINRIIQVICIAHTCTCNQCLQPVV